MKAGFRFSKKGSLILLVMCMLAVLGIVIAAYLAVTNQSMKFSNRSFQAGLSSQLAEMGLEEALRAFNSNNWATWTSSGTTATWSTSGTTASCAITFPATKFGSSGVIGSIKIRIDNYNAAQLTATWSNSTSYNISDLVGYSGMWYRCVQAHSNQTPGNLAYWVQAPIPWTWINSYSYVLYDVVNNGGTWYRCITAHTSSSSGAFAAGTNWVTMPAPSLLWTVSTSYARGILVFYSGAWYYCTNAHVSSATSDLTDLTKWALLPTPSGDTWSSASISYSVSDYVYYSGAWYRCILAHTSSGAILPTNATYWVGGTTGSPYISWLYLTSVPYNFNDVVYYSSSGNGTWYRRNVSSATTNQAPTNTSYWENALASSTNTGSWAWSSSDTYNLNDVVYRSSSFYRCILGGYTNKDPASTTGYWSPNPLLSTAWDVVRSYSQYSTALYHGAWYLSLQNSNTGNLPDASGSAWWAVAPNSLAAWDSSRNYGIDEFVSYSGAWYRCFKEPTANQVPTNATYWVSMTGSTYPWSSATAYTTSSYVNYGGVWYLCALAHTNQTPNNSTYWTALGAPVIYAQGTATLPDSTAPIVTQLRATIAPAPLFPNAIAAANGVTVGAGAGTVDSYDASKAAYSSPGGFGATIASSYTTNPAVNITGTTAVQGYLAAPSASTTPYAPLYSSGGTVKGAASGSTSIDLTRISRSPFIPNYAIQTAIQHTAVPGTLPTTLNIGTPGAPTPSIYYDTFSWTLATVVNINGPVILYVSASIRVTTGNININSTGSLVVYLTGRFRVESGSGGIINRSPSSANPDPKNLVILGDSAASTTQYYNYTTNPFYGVIYLPNTTTATGLTIASGVTNYGALSAKKITFSGAASLHYDTSLRSASFTGVDQPYAIIQWRELTDQTERAILP